jgi:hypothetical protein
MSESGLRINAVLEDFLSFKRMMFGTPLYDAWHYSPFAETDIIRLDDTSLIVSDFSNNLPDKENQWL